LNKVFMLRHMMQKSSASAALFVKPPWGRPK
jgi:hypothetical protein